VAVREDGLSAEIHQGHAVTLSLFSWLVASPLLWRTPALDFVYIEMA
jgi:hypothetical protein